MIPWLAVVGLGEDGLPGLSPAARALVEGAEVLVGGARHLAHLAHVARVPAAERLTWDSPLSRTLEAIAARRGRRVTVLATGDPLWYGIGVALAKRFAPEEMTVIPAPSAFSLAAARLGWPLAETTTLTLHGRPLALLTPHLADGARLLVLCEDGRTPAQVAAQLTRLGFGGSALIALARMGGAGETRTEAAAARWGATRTDDLVTLAIDCRADPGARPLAPVPGLPDEAFRHDGQLTKREVRAATLAALAPHAGELLWDVGAGCGSIAVEWLRADRRNRAVAIERSADRCRMIAANAEALGVPGLRVVEGEAPAALAGLDPPHAVFVGGGILTPGLVDACWRALPSGGRVVANVVTVEGEAALVEARARLGGALARIAVARAEPLGAHLGWRPMMPVTQLSAVKP
jgi:precorrin-6Y C5,15-methyltransferase (decarboxylating)